jgi:hypothetical protein
MPEEIGFERVLRGGFHKFAATSSNKSIDNAPAAVGAAALATTAAASHTTSVARSVAVARLPLVRKFRRSTPTLGGRCNVFDFL